MGGDAGADRTSTTTGTPVVVRRRGRRAAAVAVAGTAALYLAVLAVNRSLVEVRGASMEPALWAGDRLLTVPASRRHIQPGRVVVVADPADPSHLVVKRVARADGGRVEVLGDQPAASTDSRTWGPLPPAAVRRIVVRRWPDLRTRLHR